MNWKAFQEFLESVDWFSLFLGIGLGLFCLISLVKCALQ